MTAGITDPKTVIAVGELLWDILPDSTQLGGAPFNFTVRINSLGDRGIMVSRLGRDELGDKAFDAVKRLDVDTSFLQRDDEFPTGTVPVTLDANGVPDFTIIPNVAYDHIACTPDLRRVLPQADCLCYGTLVQRSETTRRTVYELLELSGDLLTVLDINLRKECYSRQAVEQSLRYADLLKLNDDEVRVLDGMLEISAGDIVPFCEAIMERYPVKHCLVTFGERGALVCSREGNPVYVPGIPVSVEDTVGSGDAFTAGFVHTFLHGADLLEAARFGNVLGAIVATQAGGTEPVAGERVEQLEKDVVARRVVPELEKYITD